MCAEYYHLEQIRAPRLLQSIFAAVGDHYLYKFSWVLFGNNVANWAVSLRFYKPLFFFLNSDFCTNSFRMFPNISSWFDELNSRILST